MYDIFIFLYLIGVRVAACFSGKVRKMWRGEQDAFRVLREKVDGHARYVWFHAASLGEFEQGRPLMERIRKDYPQYKILLTFFSPSGYEVRKHYEGADIICYLPIDTPLNVRRFLGLVRPEVAFFIKYEFWYNYLSTLHSRGVPVYSVSSIFRGNQIFFRWYGKGYARVLHCITRFFVQNEESRRLLATIGLENAVVVGDTRFDRVLQVKAAAKRLPIVEAFVSQGPTATGAASAVGGDIHAGHLPTFVAGSSWPPDEEIFIPYFNAHKQWKLVIAPHVISEEHLSQIMRQLKGRRVVRYTQTTPEEAAHAEVLLVDCFGLLSSIYRYGVVAYVGGGFGVGIHNTIEAAVWGVPVFFGPNNRRFMEAQGLKQCGGGLEIVGLSDFASRMDAFTASPDALDRAGAAAGAFVASLSGASGKIMSRVAFVLDGACRQTDS